MSWSLEDDFLGRALVCSVSLSLAKWGRRQSSRMISVQWDPRRAGHASLTADVCLVLTSVFWAIWL